MEVFLQKEGKRIDVLHSGSAKALLEKLGVNAETVLIVKDGVLVTEDELVDDAKKIDLLSVISGG